MNTTPNDDFEALAVGDDKPAPGSELIEKAKQHAKDEPVAAAALIIGILNLFS
jgi:hypothetical protein